MCCANLGNMSKAPLITGRDSSGLLLMNTPETKYGPHSADVRIHLHVDGQALPVAQLGPGFLILRTPTDHPPCDAEVTMSIDGNKRRWAVHLSNGIQLERLETAITRPSENDCD